MRNSDFGGADAALMGGCNDQHLLQLIARLLKRMIHLANDGRRLAGAEANRVLDQMTMRRVLQTCCVVGLVVLAFVGLGPATWQPRSGLGWEIDHFVGYCVITLMCCVAWPPAARGRGSPDGVRGAAGGLAGFYAGSLVLLSRGLVQRSRGAGPAC